MAEQTPPTLVSTPKQAPVAPARRQSSRKVVMPAVTSSWLAQQDRTAKFKKDYQEKTSTKRRRARKVQERIKQSLAEDKKAAKQGLYYHSGIATAEDENPLEAHKRKLQELEDEKKRKKQERLEKEARTAARKAAKTAATSTPATDDVGCCPYCNRKGHKTWRSKQCGQHQQFWIRKKKPNVRKKGPYQNKGETPLSATVESQSDKII